MNTTPYECQRELLVDELNAVRARRRAANGPSSGEAPASPWPASLRDLEDTIAARAATSSPQALPLDRLRACFDLRATEMRVLWVLLAHELGPVSRALIRDLNSEHLADPTIDTLRRAVYGTSPVNGDAWRELSDDGRAAFLAAAERTTIPTRTI